MTEGQPSPPGEKPHATMVLYCLLRRWDPADGSMRFLLVPKQGLPSFPPTKFRAAEDLYHALVRPMEEDLGLPSGSYFPEEELPTVPNAVESRRYPGLSEQWYLHPVVVSLTDHARARLEHPAEGRLWWTIDEILARAEEPNVRAIALELAKEHRDLLTGEPGRPTMDALACHWVASQEEGVRVLRAADLRRILEAGDRAFNLRVADPYLAYQKQGLGFTWSFFTAKDKQDVHVHGLPAVEIYGVIEGRLQLWHKPINQRGVRTWQCRTLRTGDWAEVEPLHCHFACWADPVGLGTVVKAAATGELAGVGKLGVAGKTTCKSCNVQKNCHVHPAMTELVRQYSLPFEQRDYVRIAGLVEENEAG
jgi:hypothetical protein